MAGPFTPVALSEDLAAEVSHTLPHQGKFAYDLTFRLEGSLLERMKANGGVKVVTEGRDIREPVLVQDDDASVKRLNGPMDVAPVLGFNPDMTLRDSWKDYGKILVIDENELEDNSGAAQILDVMQMKRDVATKNMTKNINDDLMYAGADNHINSLLYHISATPSTGPGAHQYSGSSYSWARNIQVTGGSFAAGTGEAAMVEGVISAMKAQNVDKIKFWVSSPTTFINFQKSKVPMQQIFLSGSAGKIETAAEIGCMGIPWYWDAAYPNDTTALGINPEYVKLYTKGRAMSFSKPMDVVDQWFTAWKMKLRMQVMFLNLKRQLIVTSLSA